MNDSLNLTTTAAALLLAVAAVAAVDPAAIGAIAALWLGAALNELQRRDR